MLQDVWLPWFLTHLCPLYASILEHWGFLSTPMPWNSGGIKPHDLVFQRLYYLYPIKAAVLQMLNKIMVNTGQVMFSGEIYYLLWHKSRSFQEWSVKLNEKCHLGIFCYNPIHYIRKKMLQKTAEINRGQSGSRPLWKRQCSIFNNVNFHTLARASSHITHVCIRGGEISEMFTCPRTSGYKNVLVRTNALLVRTFINKNTSILTTMV